MSGVLALASDFIERMTNPAYGVHVNEDYGLRFAALMETEDFRAILSKEASELKSTDALTSHGWIWLLSWARSHSLELNERLLLDLARRWSNPFMQIPVIDLATIDAERIEGAGDPITRAPSIDTMNHSFLRHLLKDVITVPEVEHVEHTASDPRLEQPPEESRESRERGRLLYAENTLVALLQVNRRVTVEAAIALLSHRWGAQKELLDFYYRLREGLDEETGRVWEERIDVMVRSSG